MPISYDPEGVPKVPLRLVREARERGFHIVAVVCDEPDAEGREPGGVTFYAMTPFLPTVRSCSGWFSGKPWVRSLHA